MYAVKHGEQEVKCSPVDGSLCIGRVANNLSASSDGQPMRLGFGKTSDRYERAKSSNSLHSRRRCVLLFVFSLFKTLQRAIARSFQPKPSPDSLKCLAEARFSCMRRDSIHFTDFFPRKSLATTVKHIACNRIASRQELTDKYLRFQISGYEGTAWMCWESIYDS